MKNSPFVITKELDLSTPALRTAFANNEILHEITVQFWAPKAATGAEYQYFTVTLKNARIASIHHVMPNNKDASLRAVSAYEEIGFVYESIVWTWTEGGVTATDSASVK